MNTTLFINDIQEKDTGAAIAPSFPTIKSSTTGQPEHKKRTRVSAFKKKKQNEQRESPSTVATTGSAQSTPRDNDFAASERRRIDEENRQRIIDMSPEEIEEAQQELLKGLSPSILERLLRRANIDEPAGPSPFDDATPSPDTQGTHVPEIQVEDTTASARQAERASKPKKSVSFAQPPSPPPEPTDDDDDGAPPAPEAGDLFSPDSVPSADDATRPTKENPAHDHGTDKTTTHFPSPRAVPDLDPSDPDFLQHLHDKYFPHLPADPSKLAWMAPIPTVDSPADRDSPYYPGQASLSASQLRFDFRGQLLPPRRARAIPTSKGLHHHGEAPEAAGYTVPELARLARSAVPAQRCLAFQTLGRIAYRLGRAQWGGPDDPLARGIWGCFHEGRVLETLTDAAAVEEGRGHRGSRAYAMEAIWLFEKGGWRETWKGR